jgi:Na+-translocating ferredoxin:NAD+ oxidoreductase RnfC subunit
LLTVDDIQAKGVVGAGGAGFPAHVKFKARADVVILNGAECEPLMHKDKEILKHYADEVVRGLAEAQRLVGAREAVIGIKGKYEEVIDLVSSKCGPGMRVQALTDSYPSGDEFILVYDVTKKVIPPGKIPLDVGAVVTNVETVLNLVSDGPVTHKFLTVAGAVAEPVTVRVPIGTTYAEAIALAGGATVKEPRALVGGVMMGKLADSFDGVVTKTTGGLVVVPSNHFLMYRYTQGWDQIARIGASACDQCVFCTEFCPRYLLGHPIEPHKAMRSLGFTMNREPNVIGTQFCCECNLCTMMACPEDLDPKNVCTTNKHQILGEGERWAAEAHPTRAEMSLDNRRVPVSRLIRKLGLSDFRNVGPLIDREVRPGRVRIPLKQHIGAPAAATVSAGSTVQAGEVIGRPEEGKLGSVIHASISGRVSAVDDVVTIEATR